MQSCCFFWVCVCKCCPPPSLPNKTCRRFVGFLDQEIELHRRILNVSEGPGRQTSAPWALSSSSAEPAVRRSFGGFSFGSMRNQLRPKGSGKVGSLIQVFVCPIFSKYADTICWMEGCFLEFLSQIQGCKHGSHMTIESTNGELTSP